jgi:hypothetical protein
MQAADAGKLDMVAGSSTEVVRNGAFLCCIPGYYNINYCNRTQCSQDGKILYIFENALLHNNNTKRQHLSYIHENMDLLWSIITGLIISGYLFLRAPTK